MDNIKFSGAIGMAPTADIPKSMEDELMDWEAPKAQGLYDPQNEHEACGVGFIVAIDGKRNHKVSHKLSCHDDWLQTTVSCFYQCNQRQSFDGEFLLFPTICCFQH